MLRDSTLIISEYVIHIEATLEHTLANLTLASSDFSSSKSCLTDDNPDACRKFPAYNYNIKLLDTIVSHNALFFEFPDTLRKKKPVKFNFGD